MNKQIILTREQKSLLEGLLLSDGFILKRNNIFGINSASYQFIEYIFNIFPRNLWTKAGIMTQNIYDKRTNNNYKQFRIQSHCNMELFKNLREKWYFNNKKIIPNDIIINNNCLLTWYLGDGCLQQHYNKQSTDNIKLCTNSFEVNDIKNILIPQLIKYDAKIRYTEKKQPIIIIPRNKCDVFLHDIGECPFEDYKHKWNIFPYKNKNIEKNGFCYLAEDVKKRIVNLYHDNNTVSAISKMLNIDRTLVLYYCKKSKVYNKERDKKKYKITNINNNQSVVVCNLKKYCNENNLCYKNLLQLCAGKIKKYKHYKIERI